MPCSWRDRDRRALRVVGAEISALRAAHLLESNPNVCLNVFDKMSNVDIAIGVRKLVTRIFLPLMIPPECFVDDFEGDVEVGE